MKLLLLGADGQVGHALTHSLAGLGDLVAATRRGTLPGDIACATADLTDAHALSALIERERPDWIVNAAAYTAVDRAEDEPELAMRINGDALADIGNAARRIGARVLHFSTDYVFDGKSHEPWREDDVTAPLGVYGQSKLRGENALRDAGAAHLILRTAWVYAPRAHNFLRTMLRLAETRDTISIVADQFGTPTTAALIASVSAQLIRSLRHADADDARVGTYHLTAAGHTSWHDFAGEIFDAADRAGLIVHRPETIAIASSDYPTRARRPAWSVLDTQRLQSTFDIALPHWRQGLLSTLSAIADERSRWPQNP